MRQQGTPQPANIPGSSTSAAACLSGLGIAIRRSNFHYPMFSEASCCKATFQALRGCIILSSSYFKVPLLQSSKHVVFQEQNTRMTLELEAQKVNDDTLYHPDVWDDTSFSEER